MIAVQRTQLHSSFIFENSFVIATFSSPLGTQYMRRCKISPHRAISRYIIRFLHSSCEVLAVPHILGKKETHDSSTMRLTSSAKRLLSFLYKKEA